MSPALSQAFLRKSRDKGGAGYVLVLAGSRFLTEPSTRFGMTSVGSISKTEDRMIAGSD
jgi:hypothetical protein